jgi:hypothetical protein
MKTLLVALLVSAASVGAIAQTPSSSAAPAGNAGAKAPAPKKEEPAKIAGTEVARVKGGYLGVQIVNNTFKVSFYDAKKKPVAPDVARAVLRWDPKYKVGKDRVVLNADADGVSLSSARNIRPPYNFKLFITLIREAKETPETDEPVGETYTIDFRA